jgi:hypothetical protein
VRKGGSANKKRLANGSSGGADFRQIIAKKRLNCGLDLKQWNGNEPGG